MKALVVTEPNKLEFLEVEQPVIKKTTDVLVNIQASGICGSDVHVYRGSNPYASYPRIIGHEASGIIVEVGSDVQNVKVGDTVVFEPITYCGICYACKTGHHNVCKELNVLGCIEDGTFSEYKVVSESQVYKFDNTKLSFAQATICEPYTIGLQAISRAKLLPNDLVLIHGCGPIGLILLKICKMLGARVITSEPDLKRTELAIQFGADYTINPLVSNLKEFIFEISKNEGVNVVFEASGIPQLLEDSIHYLSSAGRLVALAYGKNPVPINFQVVNAKEISIYGTRHQYNKFPESVKELPSHLDMVDKLITHIFSASEYQKAFDVFEKKLDFVGKVVLDFST